MRNALLLSFLLPASLMLAQAPAQTPAPAAPANPPRAARPATPARGGMAITVTDARGAALAGVHVEVLGVSDRRGDSNVSGQVNFIGMQAGTYRLRFSGDSVTTFEREFTIRSGQVATADITLNAAPPPPTPPPAPAPAPAPPAPVAGEVGPSGRPQTMSIVDLVEDQLIRSNEPRRETLLACSGNTRTAMVQLNQDQGEQQDDSAEITYYVVAGEGTLKIAGRDTALAASSLVALPRGTAHTVVHRGRRPLIVLVTKSGTPCGEPR